MRRWFRLVVATSLACAAGCTTTRPGSRVADSATKPLETAASRLTDPGGRRFGKAALSDAPTTASRTAAFDPPVNTASRPAASLGAPLAGVDAATAALIESELQDAPPEERETLLAAFHDLPPESIERILKARRMALDSPEPPPGTSTQAVADVAPVAPTIKPAAATSASPRSRGRPGTAGLGTLDAWGQQPSTRRPSRSIAKTPPVVSPAETSSPPRIAQNAARSADKVESGRRAIEVDDAWALQSPPATGEVISSRPDGESAAIAAQPPTDDKHPAATAKVDTAAPPENAVSLAVSRTAAAARSIVNQAASVAAGTIRAGESAAAAGTPAPVTARPGDVRATDAREPLAALISATETEVSQLKPGETDADRRHYIERHVHLRMLYLLAGRHEQSLQAIPGIDSSDQEFWQQVFWGITNYFDSISIPESADRATQTVSQFSSAVLRLQEKANLELRNVNFCHKIASFGNYEKYPRDEFSPGQEVLLYAEVANIHSEPASDGRFRTSLKSTLELYRHGADGALVDRIELPETVDLCGTHRRDYFHSYQFAIPGKLTLGPHVLKLTVEDLLGKRVAVYSLNFMVK